MLLIVVTVGALLAIGVGTSALVIGVHNETRITHVEKSACADAQADPTDKKAIHECQVVRAAAERTADQNVNCIPFRRAGYICPKPGSPLAEEHRAREIREAVGPRGEVEPSGGDATSSPSTGHSQPAPVTGGSTDQPSKPHAPSVQHPSAPSTGGSTGAAPAAPTSPTSSQPPSSTTTTSTESTLEQTSPEAPVRNAIGGVVEEVGSTVSGTVESVTGTTCALAKVLCP